MSFLRKRWDQSARRLWYIFALVRSRILPQRPKKRDEIRRSTEHRAAKPPTTVVCASRFPLAGGDTPIASPTPISIQIRRPHIISPGDAVRESNEGRGHLSVDNYFLEGSGAISRSPESPAFHHEPEPIHPPLYQEDHISPIIPSRPISQYSGRSRSICRPQSQYSIRPPSQYSYRSHLNGAEAAARGYLNGPPRSSPTPSIRPGSIANSVSSRVYRASRPTTRVRRPSSMRNTSRRRVRSLTPTSTRKSVHNAPPKLPRPESGSIRGDRPSTVVSFNLTQPKDRLRPMMGIDRYEKYKAVVIDDRIHSHVCPPVTTEFVR